MSTSATAQAQLEILAAILQDGSRINYAVGLVSASDFTESKCRTLFEAMTTAHRRGHEVSIPCIAEELGDEGFQGVGGAPFLTELAHAAPRGPHLKHNCHIVAREGRRRRAIDSLEGQVRSIETAQPNEVDRALGRAEQALRDVGHSAEGLKTVSMSEVQPRPSRWLIPKMIPRGGVTLLAGPPDLGKTTIVLDFAARVTTGATWPNSQDPAPTGSVLFVGAEDDPSRTLRPRLDAAGAAVDRVHALVVSECDSPLALDTDIARLEATIRRHPDLLMVVFDPITDYLGKADPNSNPDARRLMRSLARVAREHDIAIIAINHFAKDQNRAAISRSMGSMGWVAAARAAWYVVQDPNDRDRCFFVQARTTSLDGLLPWRTGSWSTRTVSAGSPGRRAPST